MANVIKFQLRVTTHSEIAFDKMLRPLNGFGDKEYPLANTTELLQLNCQSLIGACAHEHFLKYLNGDYGNVKKGPLVNQFTDQYARYITTGWVTLCTNIMGETKVEKYIQLRKEIHDVNYKLEPAREGLTKALLNVSDPGTKYRINDVTW
ncbi:unnamed protein product [Medioppia subpectinata]|uniref:Uncharacterized protein n=1 Tax=Medioppia subpectinata TaxID=1979941 RepID=A0A7R9L4A7_9ACAR|nr:unnamed protein product [Medioppia subpectinata]CAG2114110.1 unnamed protein product [Medioppia subpectinata]